MWTFTQTHHLVCSHAEGGERAGQGVQEVSAHLWLLSEIRWWLRTDAGTAHQQTRFSEGQVLRNETRPFHLLVTQWNTYESPQWPSCKSSWLPCKLGIVLNHDLVRGS